MHGKGGKAMVLVSQSELAGKIIKLTAIRLDTKLPWLKEAIHLPECSFDLKQTSGTDGSRLCWNTEEDVYKRQGYRYRYCRWWDLQGSDRLHPSPVPAVR